MIIPKIPQLLLRRLAFAKLRLYPSFNNPSDGEDWLKDKDSHAWTGVDDHSKKRYDEMTSGRLDGRGSALCCRIEESPHSSEHGTGETPGRGDLSDRATETDSRRKAVMVKRRCKRPPASTVMWAAR